MAFLGNHILQLYGFLHVMQTIIESENLFQRFLHIFMQHLTKSNGNFPLHTLEKKFGNTPIILRGD